MNADTNRATPINLPIDIATLPAPPAWVDLALCAQTGDFGFYPDDYERSTAAIALCQTCEVKAQCLTYAQDNGEQFGVWGGYDFRLDQPSRKSARKRKASA